uniref:Uncharacterized protein n=1 Tax=Ciona intestinalis TaxID=7719 RepID=H2XN54_CIOIN
MDDVQCISFQCMGQLQTKGNQPPIKTDLNQHFDVSLKFHQIFLK